MPHRLQEYTDRFIGDRGRGFFHLREMILEEEEIIKQQRGQKHEDLELYVCVTKSEDGSPHLFPFPNHSASSFDGERLLQAIEASCRIPVSFHPLDLLKTIVSYEEEGIEINGTFYVDGGLSGVFPPPCPMDMDTTQQSHRILVCPLSIGRVLAINELSGKSQFVISPGHGATPSSNWSLMMKARDGMSIKPTVKNLQNLVAAAGFTSSEALLDWNNRAKEDAELFIASYLEDNL